MKPAPLSRPAERVDSGDLLRRSRRDAEGLAEALVVAARSRLESAGPRHAASSDRAQTMPVLSLLQGQGRLFSQSLAAHIDRQMTGSGSQVQPEPGRPGTLTLVSEDSIDEDIEVARVVQAVDAAADWQLGRLAALVSSLSGRDAISVDTIPLRPSVIGKAIRSACLGFDLDKPARLRLMREMGAVATSHLVAIYEAQADWLEAHGVQPTSYRIRKPLSGTAVAAGSARPGSMHLRSGTPAAAPREALGRLVRQARASFDPMQAAPASSEPGKHLSLRLFDEPVPVGESTVLDTETAVHVMERLIALLSHEVMASEGMRQVINKLEGPARQIAARDPALWQSLDHPWWQLIDRVVAAASVDGGEGPESTLAATSLESAIEALVLSENTDAKAVHRAVQSVEFAITGVLDEGRQEIDQQISQLGLDGDRESLEDDYRDQIVLQLRTVGAPRALRQFLLGPWPMVLAATARRHGRESNALNRHAQFVDLLIEHCARFAQTPPPANLIDHMLLRAGRGMRIAELPSARIQAELRDLRSLLRAPGPPEKSDPLEQVPAIPVPQVMELHDGLPTVPIDMNGIEDGPGARDRVLWLDSLQVGDYCRIFILERWATAQLSWRSANGSMFVFASRHGGKLHSLSRRALEKLRAAGLAATVQQGQLLAHAMDSLVEEFIDPGKPGRG